MNSFSMLASTALTTLVHVLAITFRGINLNGASTSQCTVRSASARKYSERAAKSLDSSRKYWSWVTIFTVKTRLMLKLSMRGDPSMVQLVAISFTQLSADGSTITVIEGFNQMLNSEIFGTSSRNRLSPIRLICPPANTSDVYCSTGIFIYLNMSTSPPASVTFAFAEALLLNSTGSFSCARFRSFSAVTLSPSESEKSLSCATLQEKWSDFVRLDRSKYLPGLPIDILLGLRPFDNNEAFPVHF
mmetsp:Transcript_6445/g.13085  ORF Transcript_6445/g.13085 Transcript_6445/m.13085 type:complete len:245 (-) Transcript_6445:299-1033(-)